MSNELKYVELNDGTTLEIVDEYARNNLVIFIPVNVPSNAPDAIIWVDGTTETPGGLAPSAANPRAIYLVPKAHQKGAIADDQSNYVEWYVINGNWEQFRTDFHSLTHETMYPSTDTFDASNPYYVNGYSFNSTTGAFKLTAQNYETQTVTVLEGEV